MLQIALTGLRFANSLPSGSATRKPVRLFSGGRNGEVRKESAEQGRASHARTQARHPEVGTIGQAGHQPKAGDCNRVERGSKSRCEGAREAQERIPKEISAF